jgi:hypothetical protein
VHGTFARKVLRGRRLERDQCGMPSGAFCQLEGGVFTPLRSRLGWVGDDGVGGHVEAV